MLIKIIISILLPVVFAALGIFQIKKAEEIAVVNNGKTFISSKSKMIVCAVITLIGIGLAYYMCWTDVYSLTAAAFGFALLPFEVGIACYCAVNDKMLYVMQPMIIKSIMAIEPVEKKNGYKVYFRYDGKEFSHFFTHESFKEIKNVMKLRQELSKR